LSIFDFKAKLVFEPLQIVFSLQRWLSTTNDNQLNAFFIPVGEVSLIEQLAECIPDRLPGRR
jgi:hypothetical protein